MTTGKFALGQIVATPSALEALERTGTNGINLIRKHLSGNWGKLGKKDKEANDFAVNNGLQIVSTYIIGEKTKIYIITKADRSSTTLLLPSEY